MADKELTSVNPAVPRPTGVEAFLQAVAAAYEQAERSAGGPVERHFRIGGRLLRLRFAGPGLIAGLTLALDHLALPSTQVVPGDEPFTVCVWDSASTGGQLPTPPWDWNQYLARGEVAGFKNDRFNLSFQTMPNRLSLIDGEARQAFFWTHDVRALTDYERAAPVRAILHWWLRREAGLLAHAAAVGTPAGGLLLVGKGGSGKSTTAISCLNSDLFYAGDDYCLLTAAPIPHVHSLFNSGKLDSHSLKLLPRLAAMTCRAGLGDADKSVFFFHQHYPERMSAGFPVKALCLPRVTGSGETVFRPISQVAALKALAPSTIFQLPDAGHAEFRALAEFVRQVPCFELALGADVARVPAAIARFLEDPR